MLCLWISLGTYTYVEFKKDLEVSLTIKTDTKNNKNDYQIIFLIASFRENCHLFQAWQVPITPVFTGPEDVKSICDLFYNEPIPQFTFNRNYWCRPFCGTFFCSSSALGLIISLKEEEVAWNFCPFAFVHNWRFQPAHRTGFLDGLKNESKTSLAQMHSLLFTKRHIRCASL